MPKTQQADMVTSALEKVVSFLTGTRAVGPATRIKEGAQPYSQEVYFRTADAGAVAAVVEWAQSQFSGFADIVFDKASAAAGLAVVTVQVAPPRLARYLAQRSLLQTTERAWNPESEPLAMLVQGVIDQTVGSGAGWADLVAALKREHAAMRGVLRAVETGEVTG